MRLAKDRDSISMIRIGMPHILGLGLIAASMMGCSELRSLRHLGSSKSDPLLQPANDPYLSAHQPTPRNKPKLSETPDLQTEPGDALADGESGLEKAKTTVRTGARSSRSGLYAPTEEAAPPFAVTLAPPVSTPLASATARQDQPTAQTPVDGKGVVAKAKAKLGTLSSYQVHINRQERVGDVLQPAEDVLLSIRREPKAIRLEWPSGAHKGREVIFSSNDPSGMMYVHTANSLIPVPTLSLSPNNPLVMRNSRHPITEAGFDTILLQIERDMASADPASRNAYEGIETPALVGRPCYKLTRETPKGERWVVFVDVETCFPTVVEASAKSGDLLERYIFSDIIPNPTELASNDAFDPGRRWGSSTGLMGRLARSTGDGAKTTATPLRR